MEATRKLYIDMAAWEEAPKPDDFLVAVGARQSNSVYHVVSVRAVPHRTLRAVRYHLQVLKSDLLTVIRREKGQEVITMRWNVRKKKAHGMGETPGRGEDALPGVTDARTRP